MSKHESEINELCLSPDSKEVACSIAGYVAKKLLKRFNCDICSTFMVGNDTEITENRYLNLSSRGGLTIPSTQIAVFICSCFAILDFSSQFIEKHGQSTTRKSADNFKNLFAKVCIYM